MQDIQNTAQAIASTPATGDDRNLMLWIILAAVALILLILLTAISAATSKKKGKKSKKSDQKHKSDE